MGLQLKATSSPSFVGAPEARQLAFRMDRDDYNALLEDCSYPRFLVVVTLPALEERWIRQRPCTVGLSAGAWWTGLAGNATEQDSITVHLPVEQRFDLVGLQTMLQQA